MAVIFKRSVPPAMYVSGSDGDAVNFSEDPSSALVFVDAAAATAFSSGKNIFGAVQVTVTGIKHAGQKSCT